MSLPPAHPLIGIMAQRSIDFRGQPATHLELADGSACTIAHHGAHVLSWVTADGVEHLYLSPDARFDGRSAIRGGIPVCWPQFNQRGPLPKHGFARTVPWQPAAPGDQGGMDSAGGNSLVMTLQDSDETRALWPNAFVIRLTVTLEPKSLCMSLAVRNTGADPWTFTSALHTYLRVDDIADASLHGLVGAHRWDAVRDVRQVESSPELRFDAEFDCVYAAPAQPLRLVQPSGTIEICQSGSCTETVVWNPGAALSASLPDLPDQGWRQMLCIEAARIDEPVTLASGSTWQCWQRLSVA